MKTSNFKEEKSYKRPCWCDNEWIEVDNYGEIKYFSSSVSLLFPNDTGLFLEDLNADDWIETNQKMEW